MEIAEIQRRVRAGAYLIKRDAILHAVKEGFLQQDMVDNERAETCPPLLRVR